MKQFNLEQAKAGKAVVDHEGTPMKIVCFDAPGNYPIIAVYDSEDLLEMSLACRFTLEGEGDAMTPEGFDLFMAPEPSVGFLVILKQGGKRVAFPDIMTSQAEVEAALVALKATPGTEVLGVIGMAFEG